MTGLRQWFAELRGEETLFEGSVRVPDDFFGLHYNPGSTTADVVVKRPAVAARVWRNHDGPDGTQWRDIHTAPDTFQWGPTDAMFAEYHGVQGMRCNWVIYGTPEWASSSTQKDPYGNPGGSHAPADARALAAFVSRLLSRYRGKISQIEIWNEFNNTAGAVFWNGHPADRSPGQRLQRLAGLARAVYQAAKAADPAVQVLAPSVTDNGTALRDYLQAPDGAGGFGRQWLDGVACHPYRAYGWSDPQHGKDLELGAWLADLRRRMGEGGIDAVRTPVFVTEIGYHWDPASPLITRTTGVQFAAWAERSMLRAAVLGVRQWIGYRHDSPASTDSARLLIGNVAVNPVVAQAMARARSALCGRTILRVTRIESGALRVTTDLGQTLFG